MIQQGWPVNLQAKCIDILSHRGMTQAELAAAADLDRADVSRLLNRRTEKPRFTVRTVLKLARAFGMKPGDLLDGVDEIPEPLGEEIRWWMEQLAVGEAAVRERDDLRRRLDETTSGATKSFTAIEQRHCAELSRLRGEVEDAVAGRHAAEAEARRARQHAEDTSRVTQDEALTLRLRLDRLQNQKDDAERREQALVAEVAALRSMLATTQQQLSTAEKEKIATGVLGALFGTGAGVLLARTTTANDDETET